MKKQIKKAEKLIVRLARKTAESEVNSTCSFLGYQSKVPETVKRLRKF